MFEPDKQIYPDYDEYLEKSMVGETTAFFREVLEQNLTLREFLDSDWTMLNERLASHYGIAGVQGEALQRVALKPEDHRGGAAHPGVDSRPDVRRHAASARPSRQMGAGVDLRQPAPSAAAQRGGHQADASQRAQDDAAGKDRSRTATMPNCAACHRKIDPLGLAFENYDAVGHWRTEEAVRDGTGANPPLDASGELPDGRKFADAAELKAIDAGRPRQIRRRVHQQIGHLRACGGRMTFDDRKSLAAITRQNKANDYRLATLIESLVLSDCSRNADCHADPRSGNIHEQLSQRNAGSCRAGIFCAASARAWPCRCSMP